MNELRLPPDTPIQYEEGLWELCTDRPSIRNDETQETIS